MISVRPGSPGFRVLAFVVQTPGVTSREIAAELRKPAPRETPFVDRADYAAWRAGRVAEEAKGRTQVSSVLGRLQEMKLIETRCPPRLARGILDELDEAERRLLRDWPSLVESLDGPAELTAAEASARALVHVLRRRTGQTGETAIELVGRLRSSPLPKTAKELLGPNADGETKRVYRALVDGGVIDAPAQRWPTARGIAVAVAGGVVLGPREVTDAA